MTYTENKKKMGLFWPENLYLDRQSNQILEL